jgi:hypothetical protein
VHRGLAEAEERHDGDGEDAYGRRVGGHEAGVRGRSGKQARLDLACVELTSEVEPRGRRSLVGENGKAARAKRGCGFPPRGNWTS